MSFNILKNIILVNLKKNWIMILTFFIFLIVSCSMMFGMTSFVIGMRSQMPNASFNKNKESIDISTNYSNIKWEGTSEKEKQSIIFTEKLRQLAVKDLKELSNNKNDINYSELAANIIKNSGVISEDTTEKSTADTINKNMYEEIGYTNFTAYLLEKEIFNNRTGTANYKYKSKIITPSVWIYNHDVHTTDKTNYSNSSFLILNDKNKKYNRDFSEYGWFQNKKYIFKTDVIFTNYQTAKNSDLKIGQKFNLSYENGTTKFDYDFTYGGVYSPDYYKIHSLSNSPLYYIANLSNENPFNNRYEFTNNVNFKINYSNFRGDNYADWFTSSDSPISKYLTGSFPLSNGSQLASAYDIYEAFFILLIIFILVLVVLTVILSWFLIKQTLNNLSEQLLYLKALGMKKTEVSLINTLSIFGWIILAISLGIVGGLGIQAAFGNLIINLIEIVTVWYVVKAKTWILIVGILAFMFIANILCNFIELGSMNLSSNSLVRKRDYAFSRFKDFLFQEDINSGITFSFTIKNIVKMFVAFFITILISCLTFVSAQINVSTSKASKNIKKFYHNNGTYTYYSNYQDIKFIDGLQSENTKDEIKGNDKALENKVIDASTDKKKIVNAFQNKWVTKDTIDSNQWIKDAVKIIMPDYDDLDAWYSVAVHSYWENAADEFSLNFGVVYTGGVDSDTSFKLDYSWNNEGKSGGGSYQVVLLKDSDWRTKQIFKDSSNSYSNTKRIPLVSAATIQNSLGEDGNNIDDIKITVAKDKILTPKIKYLGSTQYAIDPDLVYIREKDLVDYVKENNLEATVGNNWLVPNSFSENDVPIALKQLLYQDTIKQMLNAPQIKFISKELDARNDAVSPLVNTMLTLMILFIVLMLAFIVFMNMTIMSENDEIIFIMKAMGYSKGYVIKSIIVGYAMSLVLGLIVGMLASWGILIALNKVFTNIIFETIAFYWAWPIILMTIAFAIIPTGIVMGITSYKVYKRPLQNIEE